MSTTRTRIAIAALPAMWLAGCATVPPAISLHEIRLAICAPAPTAAELNALADDLDAIPPSPALDRIAGALEEQLDAGEICRTGRRP